MKKTQKSTSEKVANDKKETISKETAQAKEVKTAEAKPAEVEPSTEQKIKTLKQKISKLEDRIEKDVQKTSEWDMEDIRLRDVENEKYDKRKKQLSDDLEKVESRHQKRLGNIDKWWGKYSSDYKTRKIVPMEEKLENNQKELTALEKAIK